MVDPIELTGNFLLFTLVFGMSATVDIDCMAEQVRNWHAIATGIFLQFMVLPALGFAVVNALNLNHATGITLLVVTSSPGGSYSNWWCSMFNTDLALSVTMTAISTVLSIIMLPLNLLVYASYSYEAHVIENLDWTSLFTALIIVIGAISLGLFASAKVHSHRFNIFANKFGNVAGVALVVFSATMSNTGGDAKMWERPWEFYVGVALPCLLGLLVANIMTTCLQLKKPERITVSVECCYQNVGIATSVALTMFQDEELSEAMGVPLFYGLSEAFILGFYCIGAWKAGWTKAPANAPFWTIITTSYEVLCAEQKELQAIEVTLSDDSDESEEISVDGDTIFHYFKFNNFATTSCFPELRRSQKKKPSGLPMPDISPEEEEYDKPRREAAVELITTL